MSSVTACGLYESGKLSDLEARLLIRFCPPLRPDQVQRCLFETVVRLSNARVHAYLPVLIERAAIKHLQAVVVDRSAVGTLPSTSDR